MFQACPGHAHLSFEQYELIIYGGLTGRLDQTAHTIHVLFKLSRKRRRTWVVSEDSVTCLLQEVR